MSLRRIVGCFSVVFLIAWMPVWFVLTVLASPIIATIGWSLGSLPWSIEFANTCRAWDLHICPDSWEDARRERDRVWFEETMAKGVKK